MNEDLKKALESLIDETISEIEELKKSRFSAAEVKLDGPGEDGLKGHPANGHLGKEEDEDEEDEKDMDKGEEDVEKKEDKKDDKEPDDDKDDKKPEAKEEAEKSEGKNREADPNGGKHQMDKAEGKNCEADPNGGKHKADGGAPMVKEEKKMGYGKGMMAKSEEELDTLVKSLFEERMSPLEKKLASIMELVNKIADQPLPARGVSAKVVPLTKSTDGNTEPLSKSQVSSKLFELKKSGTSVDSLDVTKAELGQDLQAITKKYNLA